MEDLDVNGENNIDMNVLEMDCYYVDWIHLLLNGGGAVAGCCGLGVELLSFIKDSECFYQLSERRILKKNHAP